MGVVLPLSYPRLPLPAWCERFIGVPYELTGRGFDHVDCWGLCWLVLVDEFGREAPRYDGVTWSRDSGGAARASTGQQISTFAETQYDPIAPGAERPGDIIVLRIAGHPLHCGIVAVPGWMLHSTEGADSVAERYDEIMWRNRVEGFWRLR